MRTAPVVQYRSRVRRYLVSVLIVAAASGGRYVRAGVDLGNDPRALLQQARAPLVVALVADHAVKITASGTQPVRVPAGERSLLFLPLEVTVAAFIPAALTLGHLPGECGVDLAEPPAQLIQSVGRTR